MAFDCFLQITGGPQGESTDKTYPNWIELNSIDFGASNPSTVASGTGGSGAGRVKLSSFKAVKYVDSSSTALFKGCCQGTHWATATINIRKAGGGQNVYLTYAFQQFYCDSIHWGASTDETNDRPTEVVTFSFSQVQVTYTPQTTTGGKGAPIEGGWNITTNQPA